MVKFIPALTIIILTILIFIITKNSLTAPFKLQLMLLSLLILMVYGFVMRKQGAEGKKGLVFVHLSVVAVLFLVGSTGWFFSPFFFTLYLSVIFLAFLVSQEVSLAYAITLVILFAFNIGEVDLTYDFLIVLSLLTTIPLSLYLRKEYIKLKEGEKEILILKKQNEYYKSKVEEVLSNVVTNFAVNLKQPVNDIKQMAYMLEKVSRKTEKEYVNRIIKASEESLNMIRDFEESATADKIVRTQETASHTQLVGQDSGQP